MKINDLRELNIKFRKPANEFFIIYTPTMSNNI